MPGMTNRPVTPVRKSSMISSVKVSERPAWPAGASGLQSHVARVVHAELGWKMFLTMMLLLTALPQSGASAVNGHAEEDAKAPAAVVSAPAETAEANAPAEQRVNLKLNKEEAAGSETAFLPGRAKPTPVLRSFESKASDSANSAGLSAAASPAAEPAAAAAPGRLAQRRRYETVARQRIWYGLAAAGHGAAAFDGWSTRRALSQNVGQEANPLLRPFAHSGSLHLAIQASPALMDFLGHRMMTNRRAWVRRMWWLPQSAGTAASLFSGVHNMSLVP